MPNAANAKNQPTVGPFMGLFYDRPSFTIPPNGFADCNNVRIYQGAVTSFNMGWTALLSAALDGAVTLIDTFQFSDGVQVTIFGTPTDLYNYNNGTPVFITPVYTAGTVSVTNNNPSVVGSGTAWNTPMASGQRNNVRAGDFIYVGANNQNAVSPSGGWAEVASVQDDTHLTLTANYAGATASAQPYTVRQCFNGDAGQFHWETETFPAAGAPDNSDLWFATNGKDILFKWNGSDIFGTYVTTMPFVCFRLRRYKNMMCYGGLVQNGKFLPTGFANSDNDLPTSMNTGIANQFIVGDEPFFINHLGVLGNSLMIYCGEIGGGSVIAAQFVGGLTNWIFSEVIRGRGPIAGRLVAEFPDRHQFIASDGEYRYNGLFVQLMNTHMWLRILSSFDLSRAEEAFHVVNEQFGDLVWALPFTSDLNTPGVTTAYVEHYLEQANNYLFKPFTKRDWPFTCAGFKQQGTTLTWNQMTQDWSAYNFPFTANFYTGSYPTMLCGDGSGNVFTMYAADTQNGAGYSSFVTFPPRLVVNERSRGLVKRVYPFVRQIVGASYSLTNTLSLYDAVNGPAKIHDIQSMPLDYSGNRFTTHYRRGRLGQLQFGTPGPNQPWTLDGYDWDVVPGGLAG